MRTTSTTCEEGSALAFVGQIVAGTLLVAGLVAVLWIVSRRVIPTIDPQTEIDRRINDLESSLSRLQDVYGQAVGG